MLRKAKKWKPDCGVLSSQQQQISVKPLDSGVPSAPQRLTAGALELTWSVPA